jgi:hypothetical protein
VSSVQPFATTTISSFPAAGPLVSGARQRPMTAASSCAGMMTEIIALPSHGRQN